MYKSTLLVFALLVGIALAGGQYYVPRAYFTIDSAGHESLPVPLRRLRRAIEPSFYPGFRLPSSSSVDSGDGHGEFTVPAGLYSALRRRE